MLMAETTEHIDYKTLFEQQQLVVFQLRHELDQLKKMIFGARQERFVPGGAPDPASGRQRAWW